MQWTFKPRGDQKVRNPLGEEFFNSPDLLTDTSSLVREAIQNSLDAKVDNDEPVRVRFKIGKIADPGLEEEFFKGLEIHTREVLGDQRGRISSNCRFLVYEDFNTEGLRGDSTLAEVASSTDKADANYTYFVHYEGEGNKGDGKRGKWGVGKIVFPMISAINAFFAYSYRDPAFAPCGNNPVLIGQCTLKFHSIAGETYQPDGWFSSDASGVPQPFAGAKAKEIARRWGATRDIEPGLSVIIPYVTTEVGIPQLRDAVIRQYFTAILGGGLVCEFEDESGHQLVIDSDSLTPFLANLGEMTEGSARDLKSAQIRSAITAFSTVVKLAVEDEAQGILWKISDTKTAPSSIEVPPEVLTSINEAIESQGVAWIKVQFPIPRQFIRGTEAGEFEMLLWTDEGATNPVIYSREGILVPGSTAINISNFGALIMTDQGPLADLLGSSEGPAHEDWSENTERFKKVYGIDQALAGRAIRMVRLLPKRLQQELTKKESLEVDDIFFSDWFSTEELKDRSKKKVPVPKDEGAHEPVEISGLPKNPKLTVTASGGNVAILPGTEMSQKGDLLKVKAAYAVAKGNAFTGWSEFDFNFLEKGSIRVRESGLKVKTQTGNTFVFEITKPQNWRLSLEGFDAYRDVEIKASVEKKMGESQDGN